MVYCTENKMVQLFKLAYADKSSDILSGSDFTSILIFNVLKHSLICSLYYNHVTMVNDDSSVVSKWSFKLIDNPRVVIYDHHKFLIQATDFLSHFYSRTFKI
jgi:hypothetical protein